MRSLLSIGRFSKLTQISVSALRFYADTGLLPPALIDSNSGYRYYTSDQTLLAQRIATLRALDMPLEEITLLLEASEVETTRLLEAHERRLFARFEDQRSALHNVAQMLRGKRHLPTLEVIERQWPQQTVLSVRDCTATEDVWRASQAAYSEIQSVMHEVEASAAGLRFELYHNTEFLGEPLETEFCVPIAVPVPIFGRVRIGVQPARRVACAVHVGGWRSIGVGYGAVRQWLEAHGLRVCGSAYTLGLASGGTEIGFPVQ